MSEEANKALVRRYVEHGYLEAMHGNPDVVHQYFADHYQDHTPLHPEHSGVQGAKAVMADIRQAMPDLQLEVVHIAADGDLVFVLWQANGTHQNQFQVTKHIRDAAPTGEAAAVSGIHLYRIEDGKFAEGWYFTNLADYAQSRAQGGAAAAAAGS